MFLKEGAFPGEGKKVGKIPKIMFDKAALFPYNTSCMTVREGIAMLLDLSKIIDRPGASQSFSEDLDLSDLTFGNCKPAEEPVHAGGVIHNTAGVLLVDGMVTARLHGICDRCAREFRRCVQYPIEAVLVQELLDEESEGRWAFELQGNNADLEDMIRTVFVLGMDSKLLCRDDCKGLCCRCGANLNDGPCSCGKEVDSRFAALQQLLKDK